MFKKGRYYGATLSKRDSGSSTFTPLRCSAASPHTPISSFPSSPAWRFYYSVCKPSCDGGRPVGILPPPPPPPPLHPRRSIQSNTPTVQETLDTCPGQPPTGDDNRQCCSSDNTTLSLALDSTVEWLLACTEFMQKTTALGRSPFFCSANRKSTTARETNEVHTSLTDTATVSTASASSSTGFPDAFSAMEAITRFMYGVTATSARTMRSARALASPRDTHPWRACQERQTGRGGRDELLSSIKKRGGGQKPQDAIGRKEYLYFPRGQSVTESCDLRGPSPRYYYNYHHYDYRHHNQQQQQQQQQGDEEGGDENKAGPPSHSSPPLGETEPPVAFSLEDLDMRQRVGGRETMASSSSLRRLCAVLLSLCPFLVQVDPVWHAALTSSCVKPVHDYPHSYTEEEDWVETLRSQRIFTLQPWVTDPPDVLFRLLDRLASRRCRSDLSACRATEDMDMWLAARSAGSHPLYAVNNTTTSCSSSSVLALAHVVPPQYTALMPLEKSVRETRDWDTYVALCHAWLEGGDSGVCRTDITLSGTGAAHSCPSAHRSSCWFDVQWSRMPSIPAGRREGAMSTDVSSATCGWSWFVRCRPRCTAAAWYALLYGAGGVLLRFPEPPSLGHGAHPSSDQRVASPSFDDSGVLKMNSNSNSLDAAGSPPFPPAHSPLPTHFQREEDHACVTRALGASSPSPLPPPSRSMDDRVKQVRQSDGLHLIKTGKTPTSRREEREEEREEEEVRISTAGKGRGGGSPTGDAADRFVALMDAVGVDKVAEWSRVWPAQEAILHSHAHTCPPSPSYTSCPASTAALPTRAITTATAARAEEDNSVVNRLLYAAAVREEAEGRVRGEGKREWGREEKSITECRGGTQAEKEEEETKKKKISRGENDTETEADEGLLDLLLSPRERAGSGTKKPSMPASPRATAGIGFASCGSTQESQEGSVDVEGDAATSAVFQETSKRVTRRGLRKPSSTQAGGGLAMLSQRGWKGGISSGSSGFPLPPSAMMYSTPPCDTDNNAKPKVRLQRQSIYSGDSSLLTTEAAAVSS